jgi:hypothetical protein
VAHVVITTRTESSPCAYRSVSCCGSYRARSYFCMCLLVSGFTPHHDQGALQ